MSQGIPSTRARFADLALATYLAPILEGRRVAVVGPTSGEVARRARVLGASTIISFGGVGEDIAVRALTPGAIAAFHGRLDVIIVPDAGAVPSLVAVLDEARRALGSEGVVVVASEPDDAPAPMEPGGKRSLGYHDLHELCNARFAAVRMVGRGPFLGYAVATLDEESDAVALDTRLMDGDPPRPEAFVAVASDSEVALDPLAVVQIPSDVLAKIREGASKALEDQVAQRDQKLKEVEAASAERWVRIQRYEHGLKELEEENRKARDKVVRMSKELEDERKLRQRIELEAQMNRRAPELPRTNESEAELKKLRESVAQAERDLEAARKQAQTAHHDVEVARKEAATALQELAAARGQVATANTRVHDLERELDETQAIEADLRAQLDEALERVETVVDRGPEVEALQKRVAEQEESLRAAHEGEEYARVERELAARAAEVTKLREERRALEQSVRELALTVAELQRRPQAEEIEELRGRLSAMASVHGALADKAEEVVRENAILRERAAQAEAQSLAHASEAQQAQWRVNELDAEVARLSALSDQPVVAQVEASGGGGGAEVATLQGELKAAHEAVEQLRGSLAECEERVREAAERAAEDQRQAVHEARNEVSRVYSLNMGLEARLVHREVELEGVRAGYSRRVRELEQEVEQLVRALEVAGTQVAFEARATRDPRDRELEALRAEHQGALFRMREAEEALDALRDAVPRAELDALRTEHEGLTLRLKEAERVLSEKRTSPPPGAPVEEEALRALEAERDDLLARLQRAETALAERSAEPVLMMPETVRDDGGEFDLAPDTGAGARVEQLMQDLSATAERLAQTEERIARVEQERDEARLAVENERSRNAAAVSEEVRSLKERIGSLQMEADTMCEALERSVVERTEREGVVARLRAEVDSIRALLDRALAERAERDQRIASTLAEHVSALEAIEKAQADRAERDQRIAALMGEIAALQASLEGSGQERSLRDGEVEGLQREVATLRAAVETASAERARHEQAVADLEQRARSLQEALDQAERERDERAGRIDMLERELAAAREELAGVRNEGLHREARVAELEGIVDSLRGLIDKAEAERGEGNRRLGDLESEANAARAELATAREARAAVERELQALRGELGALQRDLDEARRAAANPETDALRAELESARGALARLQGERDEADRRASALDNEAASARERLEKIQAERAQREQQITSLVEQLNDRDSRLSMVERRRTEELASLQKSLTMESQANRTLRNSLESVRAGLSSILVDGRGAMVAHDLMTLLKRIEENG